MLAVLLCLKHFHFMLGPFNIADKIFLRKYVAIKLTWCPTTMFLSTIKLLSLSHVSQFYGNHTDYGIFNMRSFWSQILVCGSFRKKNPSFTGYNPRLCCSAGAQSKLVQISDNLGQRKQKPGRGDNWIGILIETFIDYFCKDDKVVSRNTFLYSGKTERSHKRIVKI